MNPAYLAASTAFTGVGASIGKWAHFISYLCWDLQLEFSKDLSTATVARYSEELNSH